MNEQYESMQGTIKERELEKVDQTQTQRYILRFEHTTLRLRLHTEGFSLTCPHRTPTQGTSVGPKAHHSSFDDDQLMKL